MIHAAVALSLLFLSFFQTSAEKVNTITAEIDVQVDEFRSCLDASYDVSDLAECDRIAMGIRTSFASLMDDYKGQDAVASLRNGESYGGISKAEIDQIINLTDDDGYSRDFLAAFAPFPIREWVFSGLAFTTPIGCPSSLVEAKDCIEQQVRSCGYMRFMIDQARSFHAKRLIDRQELIETSLSAFFFEMVSEQSEISKKDVATSPDFFTDPRLPPRIHEMARRTFDEFEKHGFSPEKSKAFDDVGFFKSDRYKALERLIEATKSSAPDGVLMRPICGS